MNLRNIVLFVFHLPHRIRKTPRNENQPNYRNAAPSLFGNGPRREEKQVVKKATQIRLWNSVASEKERQPFAKKKTALYLRDET